MRHSTLSLLIITALMLGLCAPSRASAAAGRGVGIGLPTSALCDGVEVLLPSTGLCTHGPDPAPAAAAGGTGSGEPVPRRRLSCIGDGRSGQRVEVLYLHGPGTPAASSERRAALTRWVEQVEWTVSESARRLGGDRRVRWRTDSCELRIVSRRVSPKAMRDFSAMVDELRSNGLRRTDRTYLLFVDATTYCGIATSPRDDRPDGNRADRTAGYARVDRPCWAAGDEGHHSIAAHELLHTLGAVQSSAPHGTDGAHCTDEHDLLCYDDGTGAATHTVCRDDDGSTSASGDANDRLLDCRGDDYFHPAPRRGSYLDTHWNTADSARLHAPELTEPSSGGRGGSSRRTGSGDGTGHHGRFVDDDGSPHEQSIEWLAAAGITGGCNPPTGDAFCPEHGVTRGQMAAFLTRALDLPASSADRFVDDDTSVFEADVQALARAGITGGCGRSSHRRFCPADLVTRGQMAAFMTRAFDLPASRRDRFRDDDTSVFEKDVQALAAAGVTVGCNPPTNDRFCPHAPVTRAQMATFLHRSRDWLGG